MNGFWIGILIGLVIGALAPAGIAFLRSKIEKA
jgi:hypothetical protein